MTKYKATIQSVGELAKEFVEEGILVFFGPSAPEELQETSFVHDCAEPPLSPVVPGDTVVLDGKSFPILAIGTVANENLRNIGHLVLKFNGLHEPEMQGDITLPKASLPRMGAGSIISIEGT